MSRTWLDLELGITVEDWCKEGPINSMTADVNADGIRAFLKLYINNSKKAKKFPWDEIDESITALAPDGWRLNLKISVWPYEALARSLYLKMPHLARTGQLHVWFCEAFGDVKLDPIGEDQIDQEEEEISDEEDLTETEED